MQQEGSDNLMISAIVLSIMAMVAVGWVYAHNRGAINAPIVAYARGTAWLFHDLPGPGPFATWRKGCQTVLHFTAVHRPAAMTWGQTWACVRLASGPWRVFSWPFFLVLGVLSWRGAGRLTRCRQVHTARSLMGVLVKRFPSLTPAVRFDALAPGSAQRGPWRVAMSPIEWLWAHKAIYLESSVPGGRNPVPRDWIFKTKGDFVVNTSSPLLKAGSRARRSLRVDRTRVESLLKRQLGRPFTGFERLPYYAQGLAAAFAAFGNGQEGRKQGQAMLDQMSSSIVETVPDAPKGGGKGAGRSVFTVDATGAADLWKKYACAEMAEILAIHKSFTNVWMTALLGYARRRGTLPTAQFVWLRAIDRTLWYALNQYGGRRPWVEATGVWAHFEAEQTLEQALLEPEILDAADWVAHEIYQDGWTDRSPRVGEMNEGEDAAGRP